MAWNRSQNIETGNKQRNTLRLSSTAILVMIFALIGVGVLAWIICISRNDQTESPKKSRAPISDFVGKENKTQSSTIFRTKRPENAVNHQEIVVNTAVVERKSAVVFAEAQKAPEHIRASKYDVFDHFVEGELARMVCMPVGNMVIGSREFNEDFMHELSQALVDKIEISPDDSEETRYYKESVIALKKEIKAMLKNGDDVAAALTESRRELQKLGIYRAQLEKEINAFSAKGEEVTDDDVQDFVDAANIMLKEKGIEPFEFNRITRTIIRTNPFDQNHDSADKQDDEYE